MIDPRTVPIETIIECYQSLSRRQMEVADCLAQGLGAKRIAPRLNISPRTVEIHIQSILVKFNVTRSTVAAVMIYRAQEALK